MNDPLSLSLPRAGSRARRRVRRPKRPPFWAVWYAVFSIYCAVIAVIDYLDGRLIFATWCAIGSGLYWRDAVVSYRTGRPRAPWGPIVLVWIACGLALILGWFA